MPRLTANGLLRELHGIAVLDGDARGCVELGEIEEALSDALLPVEE